MNEWDTLKEKHNLDRMLFSILDAKLNDKFYSKKMKLHPQMKLHLQGLNAIWRSGSIVRMQKMLQKSRICWITITSMTKLIKC